MNMETENVNTERSNIFTSEHLKKLSRFRRQSARLQGKWNNLETVSEQEQENVRTCLGGDETQSIHQSKIEYNRRRSGLIKQNTHDNLCELPPHITINHNRFRRSSLILNQNDEDKQADVSATQRNIGIVKHGFDYKPIDSSASISPAVAAASKGFITQRSSDVIYSNGLTDEEKMAVEASLDNQSDVTVRLNNLRRRSELGDMFENIKSPQSNMIESEPKVSYMTRIKRRSNINGYQNEESKVSKENYKSSNNFVNTPDQNKVFNQYNTHNDVRKKCTIPSIHVEVATCERLQFKSCNKINNFNEDDTENTSIARTRNITGDKKMDFEQSASIMVKNNFPDWFNLQSSYGENNENNKTNYKSLSQNIEMQFNENQMEIRTPILKNNPLNEIQTSSTKLSSSKVMVKKNFPDWFKPQNSFGKKSQTEKTDTTDLFQHSDISPSKNEKERKRKVLQAFAPIVEAARECRRSQMALQKSSSKKLTPEVFARNRNIDQLKSNMKKFASPSCRSPAQTKSLIKTPSMLTKTHLSVDFQECRRALEFEQEKDEHKRLIPPGTPLEPITPNLEKLSGSLFQVTKIAINKPQQAVTKDVIPNSSIEKPKCVQSQKPINPLKRKSLQNRNLQSKLKQPVDQINKFKITLNESPQAVTKDVISNSSLEESKCVQSQNIVKPLKRKSIQNKNVQSKLIRPLVQTNKFKKICTLNSNENGVNESIALSKKMTNKQEFINKKKIKAKTPIRRRHSILVAPLKLSKEKRKSVGSIKLPRTKLNTKEVSTSTSTENIQEKQDNSSDLTTDALLKSKICVPTCDASTSTQLQWNDGNNMSLDTHLVEQVVQLEARHERIMAAAQDLVEQAAQRRKRMMDQGMLSKFGESISPLKRLKNILNSKPSSVAMVEQLCQDESRVPCNGDEVSESVMTNTGNPDMLMHTSVVKEEVSESIMQNTDNSEVLMQSTVVKDEVSPNNKSVRFNQTADIYEHSDMDITCSPSSGDTSFLQNETSLNASGMDASGVNLHNNSVHHMESLKKVNKFLKTPAIQRVKPFKKPDSITKMEPPIPLNEEKFSDGSSSPFTELVGDCERPSIAPYMTPHSRQQVSVLKNALNRQLADLFD